MKTKLNIRLLWALASLFVVTTVMAQQKKPPVRRDPWKNTRDGNSAYQKNQYADAEKKYREGAAKDTTKNAANYNLGNALYRQGKYDQAEKAYADAMLGQNKDSLARAWHNLGNSLVQQGKYQEGINAYKQALKYHPADEDTRYNLAYAQKKLKKQQPPPQQNKNQQQKQKQQQQKQQQQQQQKQQQQKQQQKQQQQQQKQQDQAMNPDEAKRMLDAMKDEEKKTRNRLSNEKKEGYRRSKDKDW